MALSQDNFIKIAPLVIYHQDEEEEGKGGGNNRIRDKTQSLTALRQVPPILY